MPSQFRNMTTFIESKQVDLYDFLFNEEEERANLGSFSFGENVKHSAKCATKTPNTLNKVDSTSPDDFDVFEAVNMTDAYFDSIAESNQLTFEDSTNSFAGVPACFRPCISSNPLNNEHSKLASFVDGRKTRKRRKSNEIDRKFFCDFPLCHKSYGTITHLNTHRVSKGHGNVF
eukprot:NODE_364_length_10092_cov_0.435905.p5 type:complete len:174 gc:universal NODE_364_length_10092_cov_0.435905:5383-5904(+)